MTALTRKLLRDLGLLRGQVITIALVVACGIASYVALSGTYASLVGARDRFYERQRFADLFVSLERAPETFRARLETIPGVQRVHTRIAKPAMLPLEGIPEPIRARVVSLPEAADESLNAIRLRDGRRPERGHPDEAVLLSGFAVAHGIEPGDRLPAVINGKYRDLVIVGTATSPEYVLAIAAGSFAPDPQRFAVIWMSPQTVAAAFRMEGAFNDVAIALQPGASEKAVVTGVDALLSPYGGLGAVTRARQPSNAALDGELLQLGNMAGFLPAIFLAVAALLVNMVLSRLVMLQQPEIATLKALGYSNLRVGWHFLELVLIVAGLGAVGGVVLGEWAGGALVRIYQQYFKFPDLAFELDPASALGSIALSWGAALSGALVSVSRVVRLPPAEAMRPPAPARYRRSWLDRLGLGRVLGPTAQMISRELERRPLRTIGSSVAIAAATGLTVVGGWYYEGIELLLRTQFHEIMREDVAVALIDSRPERATRELAELPGVRAAEGVRVVPVRFRAGHHYRDGAVWGYPTDIEMRRLRDRFGRPVPLPPDGIVLTDVLAEILGVKAGDTIELEIREGQRGTHRVNVSGLVDEAIGLQGHMSSEALHRMLGEEERVSLVLLRVDPEHSAELDDRLKDLPAVAEATRRASLLQRFRDQSGNMIVTLAAIISLFAATITVGVVYNNARVALATRSRDLASLRVLGFTRAEISGILLGELAVQVLLALPFGLAFGVWLVVRLASTIDPETYRLPVVLTPSTHAFAAAVTLVAAIGSALLVRRRLDRLDLIGVLKTRE